MEKARHIATDAKTGITTVSETDWIYTPAMIKPAGLDLEAAAQKLADLEKRTALLEAKTP